MWEPRKPHTLVKCVECGKSFTTARNKIFCSQKCRNDNKRVRHPDYYIPRHQRTIKKNDQGVILCVYCGSIATERDHIKPKDYKNKLKLGFNPGINFRYIKRVNSCRECNHTLRGCKEVTIRTRAKFLVEIYEKRGNIDSMRLNWIKNVAFVE